ncbi:MAG: PadR family transcriptional regulator [Oscillospiraceae bacterium]|nr:PadR family transcriptional regulator [Oscillospiraceae bacterium]
MPESFDRGALTEAVYYVLLSLFKPNHGYGIMQQVEEMSAGRVKLGAGTLYGALNTLCAKKWIAPLSESAGTRKKEYIITDTGKQAVYDEIARLKELAANGDKIIGEES